jgi:hypothetical protein
MKRNEKTLAELGVPGPIATELEAALGALGLVKEGRVVGYTFLTPDGRRHAIAVDAAPTAVRDLAG